MSSSTASTSVTPQSTVGLNHHGLAPEGTVHWNLSPVALYEMALARGEGQMAHMGGFSARTDPHTGRSPKDRFVVRDEKTEDTVDWGEVNVPLAPEHFQALRDDVVAYLNGHDELFVRDAKAGEDAVGSVNVRVVTTTAWHNLFAYNMFLRPELEELEGMTPEFTVLHAPGLEADPARHGSRSTTMIAVNFSAGEVLIAGTQYAGEIKKSIFSVLNFLLPDRSILPMHCSANVGQDGDVALFFGLSGTGKTTLSADPDRGLIGDDEHGWSDDGVFNFEGGCYAKVINLSPEAEPEIFRATQMFGTILENVVLDEPNRTIRFDDGTITENTRASYPIHYIPNAVLPGRGGHPEHIIFLTCDAFGVLPPIARLSPDQAMYHFLSGYTAKVAGTERGVTEPKAAFSSCFGAPFLPRHPSVYAQMLGQKIQEHGSRVWLVNTGWSGGGYGVGKRISIAHTRAMVRAALSGVLDTVATQEDPLFGLHVPSTVPDVPAQILAPRSTWADPDAYDAAAQKLHGMFKENFQKFAPHVTDGVRKAGPS